MVIFFRLRLLFRGKENSLFFYFPILEFKFPTFFHKLQHRQSSFFYRFCCPLILFWNIYLNEDGTEKKGFSAAAVGSLTQPIFAQGQLAARYKIAKANQEQAYLAFRQAVLNAGAEVNEALVACQTTREKAVLIESQVASLQKVYENTSLLMQHGNTTYLEVLTARQSLLGTQLQQSANRFMQIQSVINLYQALGGGQN